MGAAWVSTEEACLSDLALRGSQTCEAHLTNFDSSLPCYKLPVATILWTVQHESLAAVLLLP